MMMVVGTQLPYNNDIRKRKSVVIRIWIDIVYGLQQ